MAKWVDFKTVREHLSFRDVLIHYKIEEHGRGDQIKIICPFHDEHNPTCSINIERNIFRCFACHTSGNLLEFICQMEDLDPQDTKDDLNVGAHERCTKTPYFIRKEC